MVSFAMSFGNYRNAGNTASMLQPRTTSTSSTLIQKPATKTPKGLTEVSPGVFRDQKGSQVLKQGDQFYTMSTAVDSAFGYISTPTLYKPPPPTRKEQIQKKRTAIETAVGTASPVMEDLPQPEETSATEQARFKEDVEEQNLRRQQLRSFRGQRRSLLNPAPRRAYYG